MTNYTDAEDYIDHLEEENRWLRRLLEERDRKEDALKIKCYEQNLNIEELKHETNTLGIKNRSLEALAEALEQKDDRRAKTLGEQEKIHELKVLYAAFIRKYGNG